MTGKLAQVKIGNFPQTSLAAACLKLNELKLLRQEGRCPASELKQEKQLRAIEAEQAKVPELTVQGLVELYLTERIEDRKTKDGKVIPGARKPKGQAEVRRTLYGDAVKSLGSRNAAEITRQDVINLINGIVARGATVQAGNVLREQVNLQNESTASVFGWRSEVGFPGDNITVLALHGFTNFRQRIESNPFYFTGFEQ